jgi:hypothetical protein
MSDTFAFDIVFEANVYVLNALYFLIVKVARAILENPTDKTKVHLIYANVTYDDILLKVKSLSPTVSFESRTSIVFS